MRRNQLFRIGMTAIVFILFLSLLSVLKRKAEGVYISFDQEYAQAEVPLTVSCHNYPAHTSFSYQWKIGDTILDNTTNSYTPTYEDLESFITVTVIPDNGYPEQQIRMYFSKLPVLYIDTVDGEPIYSKDYYFDATMQMQGNEIYNSSTTELYNGTIYIKGRGNTTWHADKRPYKLKLDTAADLFSMGSSKHWVLLSNPYDDSLMRNKTAYDLSGAIGMPYMESTWVDIVLNGEYVGNYQFCEQIRISEDRIDITNLDDYASLAAKLLYQANVVTADEREYLEDYLTWHMEWLTTGIIEYEGQTYDISPYLTLPEIDGGFLFELDAFYDEPSRFMVYNQPIMFHNPKYIGTNDTVMTYAYNFVSAFYEAAYLSDDFYALYNGVLTHYTEFFDIDSLAKYFLITEIYFNEDTGLKSTYFYKDMGELAQMGPVWDMDYSSGGQGKQAYVYDQWQAVFYSNYSQDNQWYKGLIRDPYFLSKALEMWDTYRDTIFELIADDGPLESAYSYILESALADDVVWPADYDPNNPDAPVTGDFLSGYSVFKTWMTNHLAWLDAQFTTLNHLVESVGVFDAGSGVSLNLDGQNATVFAEEGSYAIFYFNGIRQVELPLENGIASWSFPSDLHTSESDVIQVRVYAENAAQIGSAYVDFREQ